MSRAFVVRSPDATHCEAAPSDQLPPITMDQEGREITFGHASHLVASCAYYSSAQAHVMLLISCPSQTSAGMFTTMTAAEARELAAGLVRSAEQLERGGGVQ